MTGGRRDRRRPDKEVPMFDNKTRVLLILPQDVLDRARVFAGEATTRFKRPVSLQMVLRALIDEGLKRGGDRAVLGNVEAQVQAVRQIRSRSGPERRRPAGGRRMAGSRAART
jgi:hypothetical protein